jgi:hypothetical protein
LNLNYNQIYKLLCFIQFFAYPQLRITQEITGNTVPVLAWLSSCAATAIYVCGPPEIGGLGDLEDRAQAEALRSGRPVDEISEEVRIERCFSVRFSDAFGCKMFKMTKGEIMKVPGIPPMYDYETFPQIVSQSRLSRIDSLTL